MDIELLHERAKIIREVRAFFDGLGYLETDTPLLAPDLIPESCLEVFETSRIIGGASNSERKPYWLIPSPEIWMKRLISRHRTSIYQICHCFRNGESTGRQHSPEFSMLEYYTMDANYADSLTLTENLFRHLLKSAQESSNLYPPFKRITIEETFKRWAGFDLYGTANSQSAMEKEANRLGINPPCGLSVHQLYDLIFIHAVEPMLRSEGPVALIDYPAFVPCLAKKSSDGKTVERWELYYNGIELANCFTEETDTREVRRFFESEKKEKEKNASVRHKVDDEYWKIFSERKGISERKIFPQCSGVAMGLDRLIMVLCGRSTIDSILPFPME